LATDASRVSLERGPLLVVVPRGLSSRVGYFEGCLAGSGIEIVLDRRRTERRRGGPTRDQDRRGRDRRDDGRLFGYVYGCRIVRAGHTASRSLS
jgi:hypothetical protein